MVLPRPSVLFWVSWVLANAIGEFVGLGATAVAGYLLLGRGGEPGSVTGILVASASMIGLGAIEGWIVGFAQAAVLKNRLPAMTGWIRATVHGAVAAWALGMVPSTVISLLSLGIDQQQPPPAGPSDALQLILAAGLGAIAGPILAVFQWRVLRRYVDRAALWIPANAFAWAVGMPIIFWGAQTMDPASSVASIGMVVGAALFLAGAAVGTIHGGFLVRIIDHPRSSRR